MIEVAIGIQIRNGSTRLPAKCSKMIQGKPVYQIMADNVNKCVEFINHHSNKKNITARLYFLVPFDEQKEWIKASQMMGKNIMVIAGEKDKNSDVLSRYLKLWNSTKPSYTVRLTGDCPFIPSALINKAINCAVNHRLDYISNVDENYRTMADGFDVEVMSDESMLWLSKEEVSTADREHVTTHLRKNAPSWMRCAVITGVFDTSDHKYSIDTIEDFNNIERRFSQKIQKDREAQKKGFGVYEF